MYSIPYNWHCPVTVKGARYSGCDVSFGKREKLLATGNRQVGWSSSGRTTSLILHLFHDITLHFSQTNSKKILASNTKTKWETMEGLYLWHKNHLKCGKRDLLYCMESKNILSYKQIIQTDFTFTMISIPGFIFRKCCRVLQKCAVLQK